MSGFLIFGMLAAAAGIALAITSAAKRAGTPRRSWTGSTGNGGGGWFAAGGDGGGWFGDGGCGSDGGGGGGGGDAGGC
jgi:hypothetical protein